MTPAPLTLALPDGGLVDHVVLGARDTGAAADRLAEDLGVRPSVSNIEGDDDPTRSRAVGLGAESFFELYGPNSTYAGPDNFFHDHLSHLEAPRRLTFMVRVASLHDAIEVLADAGHRVSPMLDEWERTHAASFRNAQSPDHALDPAVPRLIEWKDRHGMDERFVQGVTLRRLVASSANAEVAK